MPRCIYCEKDKPEEDMSLEHVIPQCLGGALAPDMFKTRRVCRKCNSDLGLFVDASFEKSWDVSAWLQQNSMNCYDSNAPSGLPFACLGQLSDHLVDLEDGEVVENYVGPLGEMMFWIREKDDRLFWYSGGNPRNRKGRESRAYFFFSERTALDVQLSWLSFRDAFPGKRVKKILGSRVEGTDPATIGFCEPDSLDAKRLSAFWAILETGDSIRNEIPLHLNYDMRFLAKIARGIAFCIFGDQALDGPYAREIFKGIWYNFDAPNAEPPGMRGASVFGKTDAIPEIFGHPHAVSLTFLRTPDGLALTFMAGSKAGGAILCSDISVADSSDSGPLCKDGWVILIFKPLAKCIEMSIPEFHAHKTGKQLNGQLKDAEDLICSRSQYFKNLAKTSD